MATYYERTHPTEAAAARIKGSKSGVDWQTKAKADEAYEKGTGLSDQEYEDRQAKKFRASQKSAAATPTKKKATTRPARLSAGQGGIGKGKLESVRESSKLAPEGKTDLPESKAEIPASKRPRVGLDTRSVSQKGAPAQKKKGTFRRIAGGVGRGLRATGRGVKRAFSDNPETRKTTTVAKTSGQGKLRRA